MATKFDEFTHSYVKYVDSLQYISYLDKLWDCNYGKADVTSLEITINAARTANQDLHRELKELAVVIIYQMNDSFFIEQGLPFLKSIETFLAPEIEKWRDNYYGCFDSDGLFDFGKIDFLFTIKSKLPTLPPAPQAIHLKEIFKERYFELCIFLLEDFGIIDINGTVHIKKGRGTTLFALISAIKLHSRKLLIITYTDKELLNYFNVFLGCNFVQLKRSSDNFKADKDSAIKIIKTWTPPK